MTVSHAPQAADLAVGDEVTLDITALAYGGAAIGRSGPLVIFVMGALPGERVRVRITERKKNFARAALLGVLAASPDRVAPPCPYFGPCGGCQWQHLAFPAQLAAKQGILRDQLRRALKWDDAALDAVMRAPIGMADPWRYRNTVTVVPDAQGQPAYRHLHSHDRVAIDHCPISQPAINRAIGAMTTEGIAGETTIRADADGTAVAFTERERVATHLDLLGKRFRADGRAFFQTNTRREPRPDLLSLFKGIWEPGEDGISLADVLAACVLRGMALTGRETVLDAYAGVGTFALLAAPRARKVIAVEEIEAAATDARHNARALKIENMIVQARKVERFLPTVERQIDVVVLDPPRAGCAPPVLDALLALKPARIVYVSCDPATLSRDLAVLAPAFALASVQLIDMFPQTYHIEAVTVLHRQEGVA